MAISGVAANYELDWDIAVASQDINSNTSSVYGRLILRKTGGYGYWSYGANSWAIDINGTQASGNFQYDFRNYAELWLWSGNVTVTHNSDGTKSINSAASVTIDSPSGTGYVSRPLTLPTIPRASTGSLSASPVTNTAVTININRASSNFKHDVKWAFGNISGNIGTNVDVSVNWTPSRSMLSQIPNSATGTGTITITTKNGTNGPVVGSKSIPFTLTADSGVKPTLASIAVSEAVTSPVNIASVIGAYVQNQSKLNYTFGTAAGVYSSTIKSYELTIGGTSLVGLTSATGVSGVVSDSGSVTISAVVVDSRGRKSDAKTISITVLPWDPPKITKYKVERALNTGVVDPAGTYVKVTIAGSVSSLLVSSTEKNTLTYKTDTSIADADSWTNKRNTAQGATITVNTTYLINPYVETSSFDIRTSIIDRFATTPAILNISVAAVGLDVGPDTVGVGKFWTQGTLDVGGDGYFDGGIRLTKGIIPVTLGASDDLNTAVYTGVYGVKSSSATNIPIASSAGFLTVTRNGNGIHQKFERISQSSGRQDLREWDRTSPDGGTTWTAWNLNSRLFSDSVTDDINFKAGTNGFTWASGWTHHRDSNWDGVWITYSGTMVTIQGAAQKNTGTVGNLNSVLNIPAAFRPVRQVQGYNCQILAANNSSEGTTLVAGITINSTAFSFTVTYGVGS